ncbi:Uncharacterised protein [Helicobacter muridarum]|uniref:Uncharacterized protein n=1 Tax=Helicobacter muridarum TaxID=216 RepID=A0A377PVF7_9HELI|nr:Uncharacterised protein [Helicobacter muridarum]
MKHFYGTKIKHPSKAQCFFLIERISITSGTMLPKVIDIIARLEKEGFLDKTDIREIIEIYDKFYKDEKIQVYFKEENILEMLQRRFEIIETL